MRRFWMIVGSSLMVLTAATSQASWPEFWHRVHVDFRRNNCWPSPFNQADTMTTRSPFAVNADAGWRSEHTLGEQLFDPETHELSRAGQLKAHWIATQAPVHRRAIFVLRGDSEEISAARIAAVQNYLGRLALRGGVPPVSPTDIEPSGGSGDYFDQVDKKSRESLPAPRLPELQIIGGGS